MRHFVYLGVLAFIVVGTLPLELLLKTRVYARPVRLVLTLLPVVPLFVLWDLYAISRRDWHYDSAQIADIPRLPGQLPLEELLFFLVVPIAAILTLEAVHAVRGWPVDEPRP